MSDVHDLRIRRPRRGGDLARVLGLVGLASLAAIVVAYDIALGRTMLDLRMNDFGRFYYSARHFLEGQDLYAPTAATLIRVSNTGWLNLANLNPPHFHLLILPLSLLRPGVALACWTAVSVTSLGLAGYVVYENLGRPALSPLRLGLLVIACAAWAGTGALIVTGQVSLVLLWPLALAWSAMRRSRWLTSGVLVGILASVKPFFVVLFVPLVVRRQYGAVAAGLLTGAAAFLTGLVVFGPDAHVSWIRALLGVDWAWPVMNGSSLGFLTRLLTANPQLAPVADIPGVVRPLWLITAASGSALTVYIVARRNLGADWAFLLLLLAILIFSPLPLTLICQPSALATATAGSIYFWGFLSLCCGAARLAPANPRDAANLGSGAPMTRRATGDRPACRAWEGT